jgi:hypothetical protein
MLGKISSATEHGIKGMADSSPSSRCLLTYASRRGVFQ